MALHGYCSLLAQPDAVVVGVVPFDVVGAAA